MMFDFIFGRRSRNYGDLDQTAPKQKAPESELSHIGPSGEYHHHVREQLLTPGEVRGYIAQARKTAAQLGITDFEVWRTETPDGPVVAYGTNNSLDHARMMLRMHGDEGGRHTRAQDFENMSPEETKKWVSAAQKLLDKSGISYELRQTRNDRVEFTFDSSANHSAFNVAVDRGLIDQMANGEDTVAQFRGIRNIIAASATPRRNQRMQFQAPEV